METAWINRINALINLLGIIPMMIAIYGPTWLVLRNVPGDDRATFLAAHPEKKMIIYIYLVISFFSLLVSPLSALLFISIVPDQWAPFMLFCCMGCGISLVNGLMEVITGISPKHGFTYRHIPRECYTIHPLVRRTGLLRVVLCITLPVISVFMLITFPN